MTAKPLTLIDFAKRLKAELDAESWGDIDPWLLHEIAFLPKREWSQDARAFANCLRKAGGFK